MQLVGLGLSHETIFSILHREAESSDFQTLKVSIWCIRLQMLTETRRVELKLS